MRKFNILGSLIQPWTVYIVYQRQHPDPPTTRFKLRVKDLIRGTAAAFSSVDKLWLATIRCPLSPPRAQKVPSLQIALACWKMLSPNAIL